MTGDAEVLIVGGGLAGAASACLLARAGIRVSLVEREAAPHDKICGEFLSSEGAGYLQRMGLDLGTLGALPIGRMRLVSGDAAVEAALPFSGFSVSRRTLDAALLDHAQACGAQVLRGHRVRIDGAQAGDGAAALSIRADGLGELRARTVFLATGKHDVRGLRRTLSSPPEPLIGFKMYFKLARAEERLLAGHVELLMFSRGYAGLQAVEGGRANLCWLSEAAELQRCGGDWEKLLEAMLAASGHLRRRLAGAQPLLARPLAISQVPYGFVHRPAPSDPAQLYRLGDQAAVIASFSGSGMSIALHSAVLASRIHLECGDPGRYHQQLAADVAGPIKRAAVLYRCGRWAAGQPALMQLVAAWPPALRVAAAWTRVPRRAVSRALQEIR